MSLVVDAAYLLFVLLASPIWLTRWLRSGKMRTDWPARFGHAEPLPEPVRPRLLLHAVSVGETNAIRALVDRLSDRFEIVIACTTDTGIARARTLFAPRHHIVRYPFDLSRCVNRFLDAVAPDAVALVELEVWPNFTRACRSRGIALAVVNGRISARSFARYHRVASLVRRSFARLQLVAAQDEAIARRFIELGADPEVVHVVGTMKWDNALDATDDIRDAGRQLGRLLGIDPQRPVVVAGSTGPQEERLICESVPAGVQLIVAPRHPERFDDVARLLHPCIRRSQCDECDQPERRAANDRFLLDSIGELRAAYALADVVIVGRSFNRQRGSDMMEPIALGKPTIVGPDISNFESVGRALLEGGGLIQVEAEELAAAVAGLLADPTRCREVAERGVEVIRSHQGRVEAHAALLEDLVARTAVAER